MTQVAVNMLGGPQEQVESSETCVAVNMQGCRQELVESSETCFAWAMIGLLATISVALIFKLLGW